MAGHLPARTLAVELHVVEPHPELVAQAADRLLLRHWMQQHGAWVPMGIVHLDLLAWYLRSIPTADQVEAHPLTGWLRTWAPYIEHGDQALGWWLRLCGVGHG